MPDPMLLDLIHAGETERTEFKSVADLDAVGTAVASFLNAGGGTVLVGIGDHGEVLGIQEPHEAALRIWQSLAERLSPPALYSVNVEDVHGRPVIVIDVPCGEDSPYVYSGRITVRRGTHSRPATAHEISALILGRRSPPVRWERLPALGCEFADLDQPEITDMAHEVARQRLYEWSDPNRATAVLQDLNLLLDDTLYNSAVVLFGRAPQRTYPQTRVRAVRFAGDDQSEFLENRVLEGHAFALLRQIERFLSANLPIVASLPVRGFRREDAPVYPWAALREGVINALVHRDYAAFDGGVSITLLPDRIEIWNSGRLPEGLSFEDMKRGNISRPQNPDVAHVFFLRGLIERIGVGARRIVTECQAAGLPEPTWEARGGGILLTIRRAAQRPEIRPSQQSMRQVAFLEQTPPGSRLTAADYHRHFAADLSERQARQDLTELVEQGYLSRSGGGRSTFYVRTERRP